MTLREHIEALSRKVENKPKSPRAEEINRLASLCHVTGVTVYRWIKGTIDAPQLCKEKISETVGIPIEELFPSQK